MAVPGSDLLPVGPPGGIEPRATRIPIRHRADIRGELWVGGADSALGEQLTVEHLRGAWIIDCAGEVPLAMREAAARCTMRVFEDMEQAPSGYQRIESLAAEVAQALVGPPETVTPRVYVMCKQGFNRSGLVAGRILRALGLPGEQAVSDIRGRRPGALNNQTFVRLVEQ